MTACTCHETYGAHLRAKNIRIDGCRSTFGRDRTANRNNQRELNLYADARRQGIQPETTKTRDIRRALDCSDRLGRAYQPGDQHGGS